MIRGPFDKATESIVGAESLLYLSHTNLNLAVTHLQRGRFGLCANKCVTRREQVLAELLNCALQFLDLSLVVLRGHLYKLVEPYGATLP